MISADFQHRMLPVRGMRCLLQRPGIVIAGLLSLAGCVMTSGAWAEDYLQFKPAPPQIVRNEALFNLPLSDVPDDQLHRERLASHFQMVPGQVPTEPSVTLPAKASVYYFTINCETRFCNQFVSRLINGLEQGLPVTLLDGKAYASSVLTEKILCDSALKNCTETQQLSTDEFQDFPYELYISVFNVSQIGRAHV